ncbi:helix-turn-helix transcriptional regulator [Anaerobaca lacustris]|uniref:helix-turn-helix transcriptional regulator n=1 Tax=Anaerobaca lacustris TaxID=3044600 RepID=UPI003D76A230
MQATKQRSRLRLINVNELADILGISMRHLWRMKAAGELPEPVHLRNSVRWLLADIERWLEMGCPSKTQFEVQKRTRDRAEARR